MNMLNTRRDEDLKSKNQSESLSVSIFNFLWKHDRACKTVERKIDFETEYAEYELSKESLRAEKRRKLKKRIKSVCNMLRKPYYMLCKGVLVFALFILLGKFLFFRGQNFTTQNIFSSLFYNSGNMVDHRYCNQFGGNYHDNPRTDARTKPNDKSSDDYSKFRFRNRSN